MTTDTTTRRERQRQRTTDEIVAAARRLLTAGEDVSVRAVAREMGMTAPALYRYVDGHEELLQALAASIYDEVVATMAEARDAQSADDIGARLIASSTAFRDWSVRHPREFGLIFANPVRAQQPQHHDPDAALDPWNEAGHRFGQYFGELFVQLWHTQGFPTVAADDIPPDILADVCGENGDLLPGLPPEAAWTYVRAWTRLYGTVTMEVFGHLHWAADDPSPMFTAILRESAAELGIADALDRLAAAEVPT